MLGIASSVAAMPRVLTQDVHAVLVLPNCVQHTGPTWVCGSSLSPQQSPESKLGCKSYTGVSHGLLEEVMDSCRLEQLWVSSQRTEISLVKKTRGETVFLVFHVCLWSLIFQLSPLFWCLGIYFSSEGPTSWDWKEPRKPSKTVFGQASRNMVS